MSGATASQNQSIMLGSFINPNGITAAPNCVVYPIIPLTNVYQSTLWVDEIRFLALPQGSVTSTGTVSNTQAITDLFQNATVTMKVGNIELMRQAVTVSMLCTTHSDELEQDVDGTSTTVGMNIYSNTYRRWIPPCPIVLPPGAALEVTFQTPNTTNDNTNYWIGLVARVDNGPKPLKADYPFVTEWFPSSAISNTDILIPPYQYFENPFTSDLRVQRFVMRCYGLSGQTDPRYINRDVLPIVPDLIEAICADSYGYIIVRDYTPLGHIVDAQRSAWTFQRNLAPNQRINWTFKRSQKGTYATGQALGSAPFTTPHISMVATREEIVP